MVFTAPVSSRDPGRKSDQFATNTPSATNTSRPNVAVTVHPIPERPRSNLSANGQYRMASYDSVPTVQLIETLAKQHYVSMNRKF